MYNYSPDMMLKEFCLHDQIRNYNKYVLTDLRLKLFICEGLLLFHGILGNGFLGFCFVIREAVDFR